MARAISLRCDVSADGTVFTLLLEDLASVTGRRPEARTDEEAMQATLRELARLGVVAAFASGPLADVLRWRAAGHAVQGGVD